jgi:glycosyltransferase involved in cell wall biosynthesis
MKLALVHDHLISNGGAERVLKAMAEVWPETPIYALIFDPEKTHPFFKDKDIRTSYLQQLPLSARKYQWSLPLRPKAIEDFNFRDYDVVLSNSASLAKGIKTSPETMHINYCHTPTRFLWVNDNERLDPLEKFWPVRSALKTYKEKLKTWDLEAVNRVDKFVANSKAVQERIKNYYNREAEVIYPPVSTTAELLPKKGREFFLVGGRIISYKKFDLVVQAFNKLNLPLKVFGTGPWLGQAKHQANKNIEFQGPVSESEKFQLFSQAKAFINPQVEDFGITAVEAMHMGTPVIAYQAGGALETIQDGLTGVFFRDQDWQAMADSVIRFESQNFNPEYIRQHASRFSEDIFKKQIKDLIESEWGKFSRQL